LTWRWTRVLGAALLILGCATQPEERPAPVAQPQSGQNLLAMDMAGTAPRAGAAPATASAAGPSPATSASEPRGGAPVGLVRAANDAVRRGQYEVAIQTARQALRRDEKYVPAMVVLAKGYYQLRKYELASAILDIAAGIDEAVADIHHLRGFLALAQGAQPVAIASFRRATEVDPRHAGAWNSLGALYVQAKNYREAVPTLEKAVALDPSSARAHLNLGSAYRGAGETVKAESAYRRALEIKRGYPDAHFNLGILYLDAPEFPGLDPVGKFNASIEQFTRYKERQSYRLAKDDPVDGYLEEARKGIERERKRQERERKRAQGEPPGPGAKGKK